VANYSVDIELAVKGAQQLRDLTRDIRSVSNLVEGLNTYLETFGNGIARSYKNVSDAVNDARRALNSAVIGTDEATAAAYQLVRAEKELNDVLTDRAALLKQVRDQERQGRLSRAGIRETTQYQEPIGPGAASPVTLSSRVEGRIENILQERQGRAELNKVLEDQYEKERQLQNSTLDRKAQQIQVALDAQAAAAAESAAQTAKLNERQREFTERTEAAARAAHAQTAEYYRQLRAAKELRAVQAETPVGGFPVEGPLTTRSAQQMRKDISKFSENLALGAGFPLLFGGGPGAVGGSILGSFFGTGFGGQILGGALGQALDQAVQKVSKLGSALQTLDLSTLEQSGYRVNAVLATQIQLLKQIGDAKGAQEALEQDILATTGAIPGTVSGITDAVNILSSAWADFTAAVNTLLGIIGAPFVAALGAIINAVNLLIKGINVIFSSVGAVLKAVGELVVKFIAGDDAVQRINEGLKANNQELENARALYADILASNNAEILLNRDLLNIEKQRTLGRTEADKLRNADLDLQAEKSRINNKYDKERFEINKKLTETNKDLVGEKLRQNEILRRQAVETAEIQNSRAKTLIVVTEQERRDRETAQNVEKQRKELERIAKLRTEQLSAAQDNYVQANALLELTVASTEEERIGAEYNQARVQRMQTFRDLFNKSLTDQERAFLIETQRMQIMVAELDAAKALNQEQDNAATKTLESIAKLSQGYTANIAALSELNQQQLQQKTLAESIAGTVGQTMTSAFQDLIFGAENFNASLQNIASGVLIEIANQLLRIYVIEQAISTLRTFLTPFSGGGIPSYSQGAVATGAFGVSSGGFGGPSLSGIPLGPFTGGTFGIRAMGGPVSAGSPYLVGERGPELFMPRTSGSIYPNDAMGMGGANVIVNVDASGTSAQGNGGQANQLGKVIGAAVQAELIKQRRPGGLLA
jgi:hypothetical protein